MKRFLEFIHNTWLIAGITFLFFIIIEAGFTIYFRINPESEKSPIPDCYKDSIWFKDYTMEFNECSGEDWHSYVYWRRKPYKGKYINIDNGIRKTRFPVSEAITGNQPKKIFMFGGSALWGTGVRDQFTLPSLVGSELVKMGIYCGITNFGESGYVSTQEMMELFLQLRKGIIPDLVVFYDGANDVFSTYQQGRAGIPQNEENRIKEFNSLRSKKKSIMVLVESLNTLSTIKFIRNLLQSEFESLSYTDKDIHKLANETINVYQNNISTINLWAKEYGFKVIYYWQPTIFSKTELSSFEKQVAEKFGFIENIVKEVNIKTGEIKLDLSLSAFYNISDIFQKETNPVFLDHCHVSEYGNSVISKRMTADIKKSLAPDYAE